MEHCDFCFHPFIGPSPCVYFLNLAIELRVLSVSTEQIHLYKYIYTDWVIYIG